MRLSRSISHLLPSSTMLFRPSMYLSILLISCTSASLHKDCHQTLAPEPLTPAPEPLTSIIYGSTQTFNDVWWSVDNKGYAYEFEPSSKYATFGGLFKTGNMVSAQTLRIDTAATGRNMVRKGNWSILATVDGFKPADGPPKVLTVRRATCDSGFITISDYASSSKSATDYQDSYPCINMACVKQCSPRAKWPEETPNFYTMRSNSSDNSEWMKGIDNSVYGGFFRYFPNSYLTVEEQTDLFKCLSDKCLVSEESASASEHATK
jgi:hypothetical protein